MQVDHRQGGEDRRRDDASERHDYTEIGLDAKNIAHAMRNGNGELDGNYFDRRRLQRATPAAPTVRLGHHQTNVVTSFVEATKGACGDEWRAEKDESDYNPSG
jgi:hypothetical protein